MTLSRGGREKGRWSKARSEKDAFDKRIKKAKRREEEIFSSISEHVIRSASRPTKLRVMNNKVRNTG